MESGTMAGLTFIVMILKEIPVLFAKGRQPCFLIRSESFTLMTLM